MEATSLEIVCIHRARTGREVNYHALVTGEDCMDPEDYEPDNFWQTMGGFSITRNGYQTIFSSTSFYNVVKCISFLLHSLYWLKGVRSDWFDDPEEHPGDVVVSTQDGMLRLSMAGGERVALSYTPDDRNSNPQRGQRYFYEEAFDKQVWATEVQKALEEYFTILSFVLDKADTDDGVEVLRSYRDVWKQAVM